MTKPDASVEATGLGALPLSSAKPPAEYGIVRSVGLAAVLSKVIGRQNESRLGRFVIERKVGQGGMGVVYCALDPLTRERVAIKVLAEGDPKLRQRFQREALLLGQLRHPRIVRYLDHGATEEGLDYLAMEWLQGEDLSARLRREALSTEQAVRAALAAAGGLMIAHAAGVVHRDVKPTNLFLVDGEIELLKVIDFGVARSAAASDDLTSTGSVLGTPAYMAPEQLRGQSDVRSDVYGLGATLFACLAGRPPFVTEHAATTLLAVMGEPAPRVAAYRPDVPPALDLLVQRMLAKDSHQRPVSMSAVITELTDVLGMSSVRGQPRAVLSLRERTPDEATTASKRAPLSSSPGEPPLFGRSRELASLRGAFDEAVSEHTPSVVAVSGEAGIGRSRVVHAFLESLPLSNTTLMSVTCGADSTGVPFAALLGLLGSPSGLVNAAPTLRERIRAFAGRLDPSSQHAGEGLDVLASTGTAGADELRLSWLDLVESLLRMGPLVFAIDDAECLDLASFRCIERAVRIFDHAPLAVVLSARSGSNLEQLLAAWSGDVVQRLELRALGARSQRLLAEHWAPTLTEEQLAGALSQSLGNPTYLRALLNALEHGYADGAGSATELAKSKLAALDPEARRVIRGASILGSRFWLEPLAELLGFTDLGALAERLEHLCREGLLARSTTDAQHCFQNELDRLAALASCTEEDLKLGHRTAGLWLARVGRGSALQTARHLREGGEPLEAAQYFLRAARLALGGADTRLVEQLVGEGLGCAEDSKTRGLLQVVAAEAAYWRGDLPRALAEAELAGEELERGSEGWYRAQSLVISSAGQQGNNTRVVAALQSAIAARCDLANRDVRLICLCRALTQLAAVDTALAAEHFPHAEGLASEFEPSAEARAWLERARAWASHGVNLDRTIAAWTAAHASHTSAHDPRSAAQMQIYLSSHYTWAGAWERARVAIDDAQRSARRLGSEYLEVWSAYAEGKLLAETAPFASAEALLSGVISRCQQSPRMRGGAQVYLALAALRTGELVRARSEAQSCLDDDGPELPRWAARAVLVLSMLDAGEDRAVSKEAALLRESCGHKPRLVEFDILVRLALAESERRGAGADSERPYLLAAERALTSQAATIQDSLLRNQFLERPYASRRLSALLRHT